jgi:hypothetical protein
MIHNKAAVSRLPPYIRGAATLAELMLNKELSVLLYSPEMDSEVLSFLER